MVFLAFFLLLAFRSPSPRVVTFAAIGLFALFLFYLLQVPAPCLAPTRQGLRCRNNSRGVIGGCHIVQHRQMTFFRRVMPANAPSVPELRPVMINYINALGALGSFVGGVTALISLWAYA